MSDAFDFGGKYAETYTEKCECGRTIEVSSQETDEIDPPKCYTLVYTKSVYNEEVKLNNQIKEARRQNDNEQETDANNNIPNHSGSC